MFLVGYNSRLAVLNAFIHIFVRLRFQNIVGTNRQDSIVSVNGQLPEIYDINPFVLDNAISHIIIDFSAVAFVDTVGCKVIKTVRQGNNSL